MKRKVETVLQPDGSFLSRCYEEPDTEPRASFSVVPNRAHIVTNLWLAGATYEVISAYMRLSDS